MCLGGALGTGSTGPIGTWGLQKSLKKDLSTRVTQILKNSNSLRNKLLNLDSNLFLDEKNCDYFGKGGSYLKERDWHFQTNMFISKSKAKRSANSPKNCEARTEPDSGQELDTQEQSLLQESGERPLETPETAELSGPVPLMAGSESEVGPSEFKRAIAESSGLTGLEAGDTTDVQSLNELLKLKKETDMARIWNQAFKVKVSDGAAQRDKVWLALTVSECFNISQRSLLFRFSRASPLPFFSVSLYIYSIY